MAKRLVIFVHGWSVRSTDTYGKLPERLLAEAAQKGLDVDVEHLYLGKYISFRDEVRVEDIARAFQAALEREEPIQAAIAARQKLVLITHSTGGPVVREWWYRHCVREGRACPMSHLIMLAPANFGSALATLGKGRVGRLKSWFQGVEPGQGVLDWLELGSPESYDLNLAWMRQEPDWNGLSKVFSFVLTGQSIDRKLYDHLNSYTDETGSDGVVRVASADLNCAYVRLEQQFDPETIQKGDWSKTSLVATEIRRAPRTALAVLPGLSHSGSDMGILRSVKMRDTKPLNPHPTVQAVLRCLEVSTDEQYEKLCDEFDRLTAKTQEDERVERTETLFLFRRTFRRPQTTQLVVRVRDQNGHGIDDFDFLLTSWDPKAKEKALRVPSPNLLPPGFFLDRQLNKRGKATLTYYLNHDELDRAPALGLLVRPRPAPEPGSRQSNDHFVHYTPAEFAADKKLLLEHLKPNSTLVLDIVLKRVVRAGVFQLTRDLAPKDFTREEPGNALS